MKKNRHSESTLWCSVMLCALCSLQSRFVGCNDVQEEHHAPDAPKTPLSWCKIHRTSAKKSTELLASTQNSRSEDNLETQATLKRRNHRRKENKRKNKRKSDEIDMDWHGLTWIDSGDSCPLQQMLQPILIDCCMWASLKEMVAQSVPSSVRSNNSCLSIWIRVMPSTLLKFICFLEASPWENKLTKLMFALDYFGKEIPMHAARHWNTMHISRRNE